MSKIKYVGDHTGGIELADGRFVAHGEEIEVDSDTAGSLLAQRGQFEPAKSPKSKAPADDATPESEG